MMQSLQLLLRGYPTRKNALIDEKPDIAACREPCVNSNNWPFFNQRIIAPS